MNVVRSFVNYVIFPELCDRMRFEVDCAKSHHRIISEGLPSDVIGNSLSGNPKKFWSYVRHSKSEITLAFLH